MNPYTMNMQDPQSEMITVSNWLGVNKLKVASELADNEMANAENIQLVESGYPDKRNGYDRIFADSLGTGKVNGAYEALFNSKIVFAWDTGLYSQSGTSAPTLIYNSLTDAEGFFFTMIDKLYYKNGYEYVQIDDSFNVVSVSSIAFKPTTVIGSPPTGGGTTLEAVNLIGATRINSFISDGVAGVREVFKVLVTHGATSNGNIVITANGASITVAVLANDTIYDVARKIRNVVDANWSISGERDFAFFTNKATGTKTDATYTTAQGVTATVTTVIQGSATGQAFYVDTQDLDATAITSVANGLNKVETTDFTAYRTVGAVVFSTVIPESNPTGLDNVTVTFSKTISNVYQVHTLTVISAASASSTIGIKLNGIDYNVAVTSGDSTSDVATKIRAATFNGWITGGTGSTVTFTATKYGAKIDAVYTIGTTGVVGYMVLTTIGSESYSDKILKSTVQPVLFGGNNDTRVFMAQSNIRYYSGLYDATYFPDINYSKVGSESNRIMRFSQLGDTQIILKEHKETEPSIWSSRYELDTNNNPYYPVMPINGIAGCDAKKCCSIVLNNPTFLDATSGIYSLTYSNVRDQRVVTRQSDRINKDLLAELNKENAISFVWGYRFGVALNGNVYVWDYRLDAWYGVWTNINASCFFEIEGELYFGSSTDGLVYKFNTQYNDDDVAINASFLTKQYSLGTNFRKKLLSRVYVDLKATSACSTIPSYKTDKTSGEKFLRKLERFAFDYSQMNYGKFIYSSNFGFPSAKLRKLREKNYVWMQFKFSNSILGESMPILSTQYEFTTQNLVKEN